VYHSKLSRKKKLCLYASVLTETRSIKSDFTYSFKIEKHYFNVNQNEDRFELRIDNRSFGSLMSDERTGKLNKEVVKEVAKETKKKEPTKKPSK
jgi:hypothetical protein